MIPLVALGTTLVVGGLVFANMVASNRAPGAKRFERELAQMIEDLNKWVGELVPIEQKELELFSLGQIKPVLKKGVTTTAKGIFTTIYHEPVFAYTYRGFLGKEEAPNAILFGRTTEHEFRYWIRKGVATLFIDGQDVGDISPEGELKGRRTGKVIASIDRAGEKLLPVEVGGKEIGNLTKVVASGEKGLHERAFEFLKDQMNAKEEQLFLALALLELVNRNVKS